MDKVLYIILVMVMLNSCNEPSVEFKDIDSNIELEKSVSVEIETFNAEQLIVVLVENNDAINGILRRFEIINDKWVQIDSAISVTIGKKGLAKGIGEEIEFDVSGATKREGDGKSPSGVFSIGSAFGFDFPDTNVDIKLPFYHITEVSRCIEDSNSIYYNQIVNESDIENDWDSADRMRTVNLYKWGFFVNHNTPSKKGFGSCVFFHVWRAPGKYTLGCTAMSEENILTLLQWIDPEKSPLIIQYNRLDYLKIASLIDIPKIAF